MQRAHTLLVASSDPDAPSVRVAARHHAVRVLLDDRPRSGPWNMAVDEVLLEAAVERGQAALRWYEWSEATVSLGYFQRAQAAADDPLLAGLPAVRRMTGGGAILHHHELTYSCAVPAGHPLARDPLRLYEEVHGAIIGVLSQRGVPAVMRGSGGAVRDEPFLCFGRGDPRDVLLQGHKILGSAQRRRRGAVLQHGSLLLNASPFAPDFLGVNDLTTAAIATGHRSALAAAVAESLGREFTPRSLTDDEHEQAALLCRERYEDLDWPARRTLTTGSRAARPGAR